MSRLPGTLRQYEYPVHSPPYCYEDTEGYVGDYSESDALSDAPHLAAHPNTDVKEIYRRTAPIPETSADMYPHESLTEDKLQPGKYMDYGDGVRSLEEVNYSKYYHLGDYANGKQYKRKTYYYQGGTTHPIPTRKGVPLAYRTRITLPMDRERYVEADPGLDDYGDYIYRSTPQIPNVPRSAPPQMTHVPSASGMRSGTRRHPVTVGTPRYYKRTSTGIYKRPSYLCLPVAYQPDPAVTRRIKRTTNERYYQRHPDVYYQTKPMTRRVAIGTPSETMDEMRKYEKPQTGDVNLAGNKLNSVIAHYENVLGKDIIKNDPSKLAQYLKPKIPSSIKEKQERLHKFQATALKEKEKLQKGQNLHFGQGSPNTLEVEEVTVDVLDNILTNLNIARNAKGKKDKKVERDEQASKEEKKSSKKKSDDKSVQCDKVTKSVNGDPSSTNQANILPQASQKEFPKSINYAEICQNMSKGQYNDKDGNFTQVASPKETSVGTTSNVTSRPSITMKPSSKSNVVPRILVDDALELHRTKSYVVNLIDQALSNHFGTSLTEKYSQKEQVSSKVAVDTIKKQSDKLIDKDLCAEIAQALTETFVSGAGSSSVGGPSRVESKKECASTCSCNSKPDEALYVKLLKQLRWGHLKHIQREIGKLEDLERILDSCSGNCFV